MFIPIKCSILNCNKESRARGFCKSHWLRWKKGKPLDTPMRVAITLKECEIEGCGRESRSLGKCTAHYKRYKKGSDMLAPVRGSVVVCQIDGCDRNALAKGLCNAHYIRKRIGKSNETPIAIREPGFPCIIDGCLKERDARKMCTTHYRASLRAERYEIILSKIGNMCKLCNNTYPTVVYDFHHTDPSNKLFSIGAELINHDLETILAEVDKCILLCANCHRLTHNQ